MNNLKEIYIRNRFKVGDSEFSLSDGDLTKLPKGQFAIITAWNPENNETSIILNQLKNNELEKDLVDRGVSFDSAIGYLDEHREESFCVYDILFDDAIALGRKYRQYSIFYSDGKEAGYYEVKTKHTIVKYNDMFRN